MVRLLTAIALSGLVCSAPALGREKAQDRAYEARRQGQVLSLTRIEAIAVPRVESTGAVYLRGSPEFDEERMVYRLKFQRDIRVFWIEVDARTGREVARSGR